MADTMTIYVGTQREPEDRLKIEVSKDEYKRISLPMGRGSANMRAWYTDVNTGVRYLVRRASCGLPNCLCALELVRKESQQ